MANALPRAKQAFRLREPEARQDAEQEAAGFFFLMSFPHSRQVGASDAPGRRGKSGTTFSPSLWVNS